MDTKIYWRKHCNFRRLPRHCNIYLYTTGGCHNCAQNLKVKNHKMKKLQTQKTSFQDSIKVL